MTCLDELKLKIPLGSLEEFQEEVELVTAPEISVPDYLKILQETEYGFNLENWVLTGLQGGYPAPSALQPPSPLEVVATCPPYWMLFSSPQQSRLASRWSSDLWEPDPRPRRHSLNAVQLLKMSRHVTFTVSDSEDDDCPDEASSSPREGLKNQGPHAKHQNSDILSTSSSLRPMNIRQLTRPRMTQGGTRRAIHNQNDPVYQKSGPEASSTLKLNKPCTQSSARDPGVLPTPVQPSGSHTVNHDSTVELFSALSLEERLLLEAVTERGYSLHTAIIALQKTGQHCPEKVLSYLAACERLCKLGYDEAEVEEALEMFQNCESKAEEFLHLLTQFHEMGFQQNTIKEVLLVHGNHRERALEELMMHIA